MSKVRQPKTITFVFRKWLAPLSNNASFAAIVAGVFVIVAAIITRPSDPAARTISPNVVTQLAAFSADRAPSAYGHHNLHPPKAPGIIHVPRRWAPRPSEIIDAAGRLPHIDQSVWQRPTMVTNSSSLEPMKLAPGQTKLICHNHQVTADARRDTSSQEFTRARVVVDGSKTGEFPSEEPLIISNTCRIIAAIPYPHGPNIWGVELIFGKEN